MSMAVFGHDPNAMMPVQTMQSFADSAWALETALTKPI
jgi:hypothetical protein